MIFLPMAMSKRSLWSGKFRKWWQILNALADRETDGAVHWKSMCPKLPRAFQSESAQTFSDSDWPDYIQKRSNKTRFQYCKNSNVLLSSRALGHEESCAWGHVAIPLRMGFLFHHSKVKSSKDSSKVEDE